MQVNARIRKTFVGIAAATLLLCGPLSLSAQAAEADSGELLEIQLQKLDADLARVLEEKAMAYRAAALGFTCETKTRIEKYVDGDMTSQDVVSHDYLLVEDPSSVTGFRAQHYKPGTDNKADRKAFHGYPEPFLFSQVFNPAIASTLRFHVGEWGSIGPKMVLPIAWQGSAPLLKGENITEWEGTLHLEQGTGDLVRVEAYPLFEAVRAPAQHLKWVRALKFKFMGATVFRFAKPAFTHELEIWYDRVGEKLSYPVRVEYRTYRHFGTRGDQRELKKVVSVEFTDYRFFNTEAIPETAPLSVSVAPKGMDRALPEEAEGPVPPTNRNR